MEEEIDDEYAQGHIHSKVQKENQHPALLIYY